VLLLLCFDNHYLINRVCRLVINRRLFVAHLPGLQWVLFFIGQVASFNETLSRCLLMDHLSFMCNTDLFVGT